MSRVSIIIINWNGWKDTIECLESVYRINYSNYDVIVVDNASQDGSIERIKEYTQGKLKVKSKFFDYNPRNKPIKVFELSEEEALKGRFNKPLYEKYDPDRRLILIKNRNNYGFAGGNNRGIKFALSALNPDYILLLNNDTVVEPNFLEELIKVAEENPQVGVVGPKVLYYDSPRTINSAGAKINWITGSGTNVGFREFDAGQYNSPADVDYAHGACMIIKSKSLYKSGLFDERFFILIEETDLCYRIHKRGYKIIYWPYSRIYHKEGLSRKKHSLLSYYHQFKNRILFLCKSKRIFIGISMAITVMIAIKNLIKGRTRVAITIIRGILDGIDICRKEE